MEVKDFDVVGSFNKDRIIPFDPERTVNLFEYIDQDGKKLKSLFYTSGLKTAISFPDTSVGVSRATFVFQGVGESSPHMYQVFGLDVYRIDQFLAKTKIFSFTSTVNIGYVGIDANTHQVIFVDGQQGWIWDVTTSLAVQITDPAFPLKPIDVCNLDGFFVVANGNTNNFQLSMFNNGLVWGPSPLGPPAETTMTVVGPPTTNILLSGNIDKYQVGVPIFFGPPNTLPAPLVAGTQYFVVGHPGGNNITVSAVQGGAPITLTTSGTAGPFAVTNGGQLQQASITSHPGNIVACRTLHRRLFLFSENFTEVWENQGAGANLPFRRNNSLLLEYGTPAIGSIATGFDTMFFLSQDRDGQGSIMEVTGTQASPASTHALDFVISQYAENPVDLGVSDARSFLVKENGIIFYQINFTKANHTFVYNVTLSNPQSENQKLWHELEMLDGSRHPAQTHGYFIGKNYVGSYLEPITYLLDNSLLTNDGEAIHRTRITRSFVPPDYRRIRVDRFQLDLLQGSISASEVTLEDLLLTTEDGDIITTEDGDLLIAEQEQENTTMDRPVVFLSISKDGGQTFGYIQPREMGAVGQRSFRTLWRKLGTIPRGQGFVAKIEFFDAYPFSIMGASWAMEVLPE